MKTAKIFETGALLATFLMTLGATVVPFYYEATAVKSSVPPGTRVLTLTGMASTGIWTNEPVRGANYWARSFRAARPILRVGEPVLLRLKSADVVHTFYSPGAGIGPVEVYPGHVVEVLVTPSEEGVFEYYCTTMCGDPHFAMRGLITVRGDRDPPPVPRAAVANNYWLESPPPTGSSRVERGEWLFRQKGCFTCHGPEGQGGVPNWNYVDDTVPALNTLAETMFLFFPEDISAVVEPLEQGVPLESLEDSPAVRRFASVLAQYESIRKVIRHGNPAGKKDPAGPLPPLEMPAWEHRVSDEDIDSILAYLLTREPGEQPEQ